jgi:CubicO group peptidase (beta-lactamase class C family)
MLEDIKKLLESGVSKHHFPGAHYAIVYHDGTILKDVVGYKETLNEKVVNTSDVIYDCASLTKVICTTSMIMKLIEDGDLTLDTKVSSILRRFKHPSITIESLLTHTSKLPADVRNSRLMSTKKEVIDYIYNVDLLKDNNPHIVYSDIGFILLGEVIETITKKPLDVYAKEVIFDPLQMNDSSYHPDPNRCAPTEYRKDVVFEGLLRGKVHDEKAYAMNGVAGHAGLFSTVNDLSKFILSFLRNDESVLMKNTVDMLFPLRAREVRQDQTDLVRSLGWDKPTIGGTAGDYFKFEETIVHTGFTGCNIWIDRYHGVGFVMLSNAVHPKRENNKIIQYRNHIGNIILKENEED